MQTYNYKIYDNSNNFKKVLNPDIIQSNIRFNASKNGGQGDLNISLSTIDTDIKHSDIVRVFYSSGEVKNKLIYSGYVDEIEEYVDNGENMFIGVVGLGSLLTNIYFQSGGLREFTLNKTASEIVTDIANYMNSINSNIGVGEIETTTTVLSLSFNNNYSLSALDKVVEKTPNYYYYIDENGLINFKSIKTDPNHFITFQKDLQSYEENNVAKIYNKLYLNYDTGSKTYEDLTSIASYGIREQEVNDSTIKDLATADEFAQKFFEENAQPNQSRMLEVNREFKTSIVKSDITWGEANTTWADADYNWDNIVVTNIFGYESIQPGDIVKILNFKKIVKGEVQKLEFRRDTIKLTLNKSYNFIQLIKE